MPRNLECEGRPALSSRIPQPLHSLFLLCVALLGRGRRPVRLLRGRLDRASNRGLRDFLLRKPGERPEHAPPASHRRCLPSLVGCASHALAALAGVSDPLVASSSGSRTGSAPMARREVRGAVTRTPASCPTSLIPMSATSWSEASGRGCGPARSGGSTGRWFERYNITDEDDLR